VSVEVGHTANTYQHTEETIDRTTPGVYRMDHDPDRHDDRAIELALAATHLLERPTKGSMRFMGMAGRGAPSALSGLVPTGDLWSP